MDDWIQPLNCFVGAWLRWGWRVSVVEPLRSDHEIRDGAAKVWIGIPGGTGRR